MEGGNDQSYCKDCRLVVTVVVDHAATGDTICTDYGLILEERYLDTVIASAANKRQSNATSLPRVHLDIGRESSSQENSLVVAFRAISDMAPSSRVIK
uniref:Uncharacterized protein n=1 Tax=Leersia perrieri TaxID=77586 RepID=A0A0D9VQN2_9ORYZ